MSKENDSGRTKLLVTNIKFNNLSRVSDGVVKPGCTYRRCNCGALSFIYEASYRGPRCTAL